MASVGDENLQLTADYTQTEYQFQAPSVLNQTFTGDNTTIVTTVNGASGPNINIISTIGFVFTGGAGGNVVMSVSDAALVRSSISAAKSGINTDITELNGASQVDVSSDYKVAGTQVVTAQQAAIPDADGTLSGDTTTINTILAALRTHGLIDT